MISQGKFILLAAMKFVTTTQGARSLVHQGYKYTLNRRTADRQTYWRCHDRSCPGRAVTDTTDQLVSCNNKHSHPLPPTERALEVVKKMIKNRAKRQPQFSAFTMISLLDEMRHITFLQTKWNQGLDEMGTNRCRSIMYQTAFFLLPYFCFHT